MLWTRFSLGTVGDCDDDILVLVLVRPTEGPNQSLFFYFYYEYEFFSLNSRSFFLFLGVLQINFPMASCWSISAKTDYIVKFRGFSMFRFVHEQMTVSVNFWMLHTSEQFIHFLYILQHSYTIRPKCS